MPTSAADRQYWTSVATRLARPVLEALANRRLKATMPVEAKDPRQRAPYSHLEALGRLLAGLAPWFELREGEAADDLDRAKWATLAREAIDAATDPASPDFLNFAGKGQPLVDAAFLGEALLRAPTALWDKLSPRVQANVVTALQATRATTPPETNWVLFAAMVEATLHRAGAKVDGTRLRHGIDRHRQWYLGDGVYGDGPHFHWDYYNSFVIQPMLLEVLEAVGPIDGVPVDFVSEVRQRLTRYAAIQERLVAPDGSYPVTGRSIAYRCGAFQALALASWRGLLPTDLPPAQARTALTAVIRRTMEAPGTFDRAGWLTIGLCGHQPGLAESYISTGSLYLCATALLPLGLPSTHVFWSGAALPTTSQRLWSGADGTADHAFAG